MHKRRGFTLIEIIIALFIFAIIALIISYGLHTVFKAKQRVSFHQERLAKLQMALLLFEHDVTQLTDLTDLSNASGNNLTTTYGNNTHFNFITTDFANPLGLEYRSNLMHVEYQLQNGKLIRTIYTSIYADKHPDATSRALLNHVKSLRFRYLSKQGFENQWPPPDQSILTPPRAVEITLSISGWGNISQLYPIRGTTLENT